MRFLFPIFSSALLLAIAPASALADTPAPTPSEACPLNEDGLAICPKPRLEMGVRTGVALPAGQVVEGLRLNSSLAAQIPVQLDFGFHPDRHVFVGVYGHLGTLVPASGACDGGQCGGSDVRVGIEALYHFRPDRRWDPWVGLGTGYEWLHASESRGAVDVSQTVHGFELANLQGGLDYSLCRGLRLGPFASFAVGKYTSATTTWTSETLVHARTGDIAQTALHEWLTLGVRGAFDL